MKNREGRVDLKELLIVACVLLISWCISKMMPEIEYGKEYYIQEAIQCLLDYILCFIVLLRHFGAMHPIQALVVAVVLFGVVNAKDWIQLRKKKNLVY